MANTINNTTDAELLRSILDGSIEGAFEDDTITVVKSYKFYNCSNLTKIYLPEVTGISESTFAYCSSLKSAILPKLYKADGNNNAFLRCSSLETVDLSGFAVTNINKNAIDTMFDYCTSLKKLTLPFISMSSNGQCRIVPHTSFEIFVFPNLISVGCNFGWAIASTIKKIDFGAATTFVGGTSSSSLFENTKPTVFEALIIRSSTVPTLSNTVISGKLATDATKGQSDVNSIYKIYVPQALISEYQSATNWSAYSTFFEPIEGSEYDGYWADGTPIGIDGSGMIAYYDVGNVNDWDSETKTITSHVENDFNAWRQTSNNQFNINNAANIPTDIYDDCYMNGGFIINFGDGTTSNVSIGDKYDIITIEFLYTSSSNSSINISKADTNESLGTQIIGYVGGLDLTFKHVVLELSKTGMKLFVNKVLKISNNNNNIDIPVINISASNNAYIGHVSVWNRALTDEEIEEHYDYYVANFHVGETAFDSSGNFIAGS